MVVSSLSSQCKEFLGQLLFQDPALGHAFIVALTVPNRADYRFNNESLQLLYMQAISKAQQKICKLMKDKVKEKTELENYTNKLYSLLALVNPSPDMKRISLKQMFEELLRLMDSTDDSVISYSAVYSVLMGRQDNYLVREFCNLNYNIRHSSKT